MKERNVLDNNLRSGQPRAVLVVCKSKTDREQRSVLKNKFSCQMFLTFLYMLKLIEKSCFCRLENLDITYINHGHNLVNLIALWGEKTGLKTYRHAWLNKPVYANWRLTLQDHTYFYFTWYRSVFFRFQPKNYLKHTCSRR